jgi:hypothetical protein
VTDVAQRRGSVTLTPVCVVDVTDVAPRRGSVTFSR